jgi:hypothetical protein
MGANERLDALRPLIAAAAELLDHLAAVWASGDMSEEARQTRLFAAVAYGARHQDLIEAALDARRDLTIPKGDTPWLPH